MPGFSTLVPLVLSIRFAAALTSLYIPDFDPQPITANEIGVGADGATTWYIAPGQPTAGFSDDDSGINGPATLILGPSTAAVIYNDPSGEDSFSENCQISAGLAACQAVVTVSEGYEIDGYGTDDGDYSTATAYETVFVSTSTVSWTEYVQPFAVQGGGWASIVTTTATLGEVTSYPSSIPAPQVAAASSGSGSPSASQSGSSVASTSTASSSSGSSGSSGSSSSSKTSGATGFVQDPIFLMALAGAAASVIFLA